MRRSSPPPRPAGGRTLLVKRASNPADSNSSHPSGGGSIPASVSRGRILLVEDNALNQRVAVGMLTRLGYHAEVVGNGSEAVEAVARGGFEAVLMDCRLPGLDGYQASAEIRRREGDEHIPIIAMTAATLPDDRVRCLAAGMDDYVTKPILATELEATLSRWVAPGAAAGVGAEPDPGDAGPPGHPELLELFWGTASSDLANLRAAVEVGDAPGIDRAAHHLKGAAVTVGLDRVVELCRRLELLGGAGQLGPASAVLDQLEEEFAR